MDIACVPKSNILNTQMRNIHQKDWCWSWSSNTLATWCEKPAHWKRLMMGKIEGKRRRGQLRMRWLDSIIDSMAMSLSKLWKTVENRGVCLAVVHRVTKSQIWLNSWTTAFTDGKNEAQGITDHVLSEVKQLVEQGFDSRQTLEPECSNPKLYFIVYINFYNKISL